MNTLQEFVFVILVVLLVPILGLALAYLVSVFSRDRNKKVKDENVKKIEDSEKTWMVPENRTEELWSLWDDWSRKKNHSHLARYQFWKTIEELFPETKGKPTCFEPDENAVRIMIHAGYSAWDRRHDKMETES